MACESTYELARETSANGSQKSNVAPAELGQIFHCVLELLVERAPVPIDQIADRSGLTLERTTFILDEIGAERDEYGKITGLGLSLQPTPHEYHVEGKIFYTWCAPDALLFPKLLAHTARIVSSDPVTDEKVTLTVTPEGFEELSPSTAVVSWTRKADGRDIRGTFCRYGRFFTRPQTAQQWQQKHSTIEILEVQEALQAIRQMEALLRS